jgi:predicted RNase H-like nuclease (RuvC/YqgF family)
MNEEVSQVIQNNLIKPIQKRLKELNIHNENLSEEIENMQHRINQIRSVLIIISLISILNTVLIIIFK